MLLRIIKAFGDDSGSGSVCSGCSTTCRGDCGNNCYDLCFPTGCGGGCMNNCTGTCQGGCGGCDTSCSGGCKSGCRGCRGCSDACMRNCTGSCSTTCADDCSSSCKTTCLDTCLNGCTSTCKSLCNSGCTSTAMTSSNTTLSTLYTNLNSELLIKATDINTLGSFVYNELVRRNLTGTQQAVSAGNQISAAVMTAIRNQLISVGQTPANTTYTSGNTANKALIKEFIEKAQAAYNASIPVTWA